MSPVLAGLGAAVAFASATLSTARVSRIIGPTSTVAAVLSVGLVVIVIAVLVSGPPHHLHASSVWWLVCAGVCNVAGFLLAAQFAALTVLVAYVFLGERPGRVQLTGLALIIIGVTALSTQQ